MPYALSGTGLTQFGRALKELDIELICAHSPQAKGRVERANQTLQDRLPPITISTIGLLSARLADRRLSRTVQK